MMKPSPAHRGLIPQPWIQLPQPEDELQGKWMCGRWYRPLDGGSYATDGSGGKASSDPLCEDVVGPGSS
eukprot:3715734-Heterocapsa_arctica.AAC.1